MATALRVAVIPELQEALRNTREENEALLGSACEAIVAQRIADLQFGFVLVAQCSLWVSGPPEAIQTLRDYLDGEDMRYEAYD